MGGSQEPCCCPCASQEVLAALGVRQLGLEHLAAALEQLAGLRGAAAAVGRAELLQLLAWVERLAEAHELAGGRAEPLLAPLRMAQLLPVQVGPRRRL